MKKLIYFHRNRNAGYSIEKVSKPYTDKINDKIILHVPEARASPLSLLRNFIFIFRKRQKDAIHHITGDIHYGLLALIGRKTVITIHDTGTVDFNKGNKIKRWITFLLWFKIPLKIADKIVCISDITKQYVQKYTNRNDILVIPNCVDSQITFHEKKEIRGNLKILMIGTSPNKNIERQIIALQGLKCHLTIIGKLTNEQIELLEENEISYSNKINLSDSEVYDEYYKADLVMFCSLFEGFGMPIVEANKAGTPVLCSDIPVMHEVGNVAAYFVNPFDISSIRQGVLDIMENYDLRQDLIVRGIRNSERYEIEKIYPLWEKVYEGL